jgi:four helix bundle protein
LRRDQEKFKFSGKSSGCSGSAKKHSNLVRSSEFGAKKLKTENFKLKGEGFMDEERFDFENLKVYQKALEYVDFVYENTKHFPKTEIFSLIDQFKRASISICLNIAEGSGGSKVEFNRFLKIARRSIRECVAITEISCRQKFIGDKVKQQSRSLCSELSRMINGLIKSLKRFEKSSEL